MAGAAQMSINDLILIGTGFVLARVIYVWYAPTLARIPRRKR
jgi:hypothetical protein